MYQALCLFPYWGHDFLPNIFYNCALILIIIMSDHLLRTYAKYSTIKAICTLSHLSFPSAQ